MYANRKICSFVLLCNMFDVALDFVEFIDKRFFWKSKLNRKMICSQHGNKRCHWLNPSLNVWRNSSIWSTSNRCRSSTCWRNVFVCSRTRICIDRAFSIMSSCSCWKRTSCRRNTERENNNEQTKRIFAFLHDSSWCCSYLALQSFQEVGSHVNGSTAMIGLEQAMGLEFFVDSKFESDDDGREEMFALVRLWLFLNFVTKLDKKLSRIQRCSNSSFELYWWVRLQFGQSKVKLCSLNRPEIQSKQKECEHGILKKKQRRFFSDRWFFNELVEDRNNNFCTNYTWLILNWPCSKSIDRHRLSRMICWLVHFSLAHDKTRKRKFSKYFELLTIHYQSYLCVVLSVKGNMKWDLRKNPVFSDLEWLVN